MTANPTISINDIKQAVCERYGITMRELESPAKRKSKTAAAIARQVASFLMKMLTDTNIKVIGKELGYADHSTAMKNCKLTLKIMSVDKDFRNDVTALETKLKDPCWNKGLVSQNGIV